MTDGSEGDGRAGRGTGEPERSARYEAFLRGERPEDICIYLHEEGVGSMADLLEIGSRVDDGVVLVLPGDDGKAAFERATGLDAMDFAGMAMGTDGDVAPDCTAGACPAAPDDGAVADDGAVTESADHYAKFVFAFAEAQNEGVGGIYAEGDVVHAYAACACGTTYADKWVAGSEAAR